MKTKQAIIEILQIARGALETLDRTDFQYHSDYHADNQYENIQEAIRRLAQLEETVKEQLASIERRRLHELSLLTQVSP